MEHDKQVKKMIHSMHWKITHLLELGEDQEIQAFRQKAEEEGLIESPRNFTIVHVIECIDLNEPINVTSIAEKMELSKASITKITSKLIEDGFIRRTQLNDNKKEVYFLLTPKGKRLADLHNQLHRIAEERFFQFLNRYTPEQLDFLKQFSQDMAHHLEQKISEGIEME